MTKQQQQVLEFHKKFNCTINTKPTWPSVNDMLLREDLIEEEFIELKNSENLIDVADALGDLLYVIYGAAITYGIDLEPIFDEIHRSNMSKVWEDGKIHKNEAGKHLKPPTYSPPNLAPILGLDKEAAV